MNLHKLYPLRSAILRLLSEEIVNSHYIEIGTEGVATMIIHVNKSI